MPHRGHPVWLRCHTPTAVPGGGAAGCGGAARSSTRPLTQQLRHQPQSSHGGYHAVTLPKRVSHDGSAKQVMLATQFHATVDPKWLPIQRRSTAGSIANFHLTRIRV